MEKLLNDLKADFGQAYVRAVAHAASCFVQEASRSRDNDGVDLTILYRPDRRGFTSQQLDVQLKTTASIDPGETFSIDLGIKNYDELRSDEYQVPRILVVVHVPETPREWVVPSPDHLLLRYCGYWKSLCGVAASANDEKVRVRLSRSQCFHVDPLRTIMQRVRETGRP